MRDAAIRGLTPWAIVCRLCEASCTHSERKPKILPAPANSKNRSFTTRPVYQGATTSCRSSRPFTLPPWSCSAHVPGENPHCAVTLLVDPGRTDHTRPFSVHRRGPRSDHDEGSCWNVSRGSITRPGHSLSTLRRVDHSTTTQDSLPAAGQALPDGLAARRVPARGFRAVSYIAHPPFPSFVAQGP